MKIGVTNFLPERLTQARDARHLSQVALSQLLGKTSSTSVSRWEKGTQFPEQDALLHLAKAMNLPVSFFVKPLLAAGNSPQFFRSMAAITKGARGKGSARLRWGQEISLLLQEVVDFPASNVLDYGLNHDFKSFEDSEIENVAARCRAQWNLGNGPISDVHLLLENNGIVVIHDEIEVATMDGLSEWCNQDDRGYIYIAIDKPSAVRCRFSAAHELAHLVLHRHIDKTALSKTEEFSLIESQANRFAAAFLLPSDTFSSELKSPSLSSMLSLKERWKVSIAAMIVRCKQLHIIDEAYANQLWKHYSSRGWRKAEPLDEDIVFEYPRLLQRSITLLAEQGGWTLHDILQNLPFAASDIERLSNLPDGYLTESALPKREAPVLKNTVGNVVQFDRSKKHD